MPPSHAFRRRRLLLAGLAAPWVAPASHAEAWPARPIRIVVPFPPGSAADAVPRAIAARLQVALGTPCLIENHPGASGTIGAEIVAHAPADGYTFLSHSSSIVIQPHMGPTPFDVLRDLVPVTQTVSGSYVLVVPPSFPASNLREFVAAVRRAPGRYSYGSYGSGSGPHLAMEMLKSQADLFIVHVPFRGAAPALREVLAGRLDMAFDTTFATVPYLRAGRLKAIALGGPHAIAALPGVGTVAQLYPGFDTDGWQGLFAPAGTDLQVVHRVAVETARALAAPELAGMITDLGFLPLGTGPGSFAGVVAADYRKWGRIVRERRIRPD